MIELIEKVKQGIATEAEQKILLQLLFLAQDKQKLIELDAQIAADSNLNVAIAETQTTPLTFEKGGKRSWYGWVAAASLLFVVSLSWWLIKPKTSQSVAFADTYLEEAPPPYGNTRLSGTGINIEENETNAKSAYAKGDYTTTVNSLTNIISTGKATPEQHYFLAISCLHLSPPDWQKAIVQLLKTREVSPNYNNLEVDWHLALAYIKTNQMDLAKSALKNIEGKYRSKEVGQLLEALPTH